MLEKAENEVNIMFFPIPESLMLSLIQWWYTTKHYKDKFSSHVIFFSIKLYKLDTILQKTKVKAILDELIIKTYLFSAINQIFCN